MSHITSHSQRFQRLLWCHTDLTDRTDTKSEGRRRSAEGRLLPKGRKKREACQRTLATERLRVLAEASEQVRAGESAGIGTQE